MELKDYKKFQVGQKQDKQFRKSLQIVRNLLINSSNQIDNKFTQIVYNKFIYTSDKFYKKFKSDDKTSEFLDLYFDSQKQSIFPWYSRHFQDSIDNHLLMKYSMLEFQKFYLCYQGRRILRIYYVCQHKLMADKKKSGTLKLRRLIGMNAFLIKAFICRTHKVRVVHKSDVIKMSLIP